jgi:hypothetical protein
MDSQLQQALLSQQHVHSLYQFESMMNILIAACTYSEGAMDLIDNNCVNQYLTQFKCLTSRVFWTAYNTQPSSVNANRNRNRDLYASRLQATANISSVINFEPARVNAGILNPNPNPNANRSSQSLSTECSRYLQILIACLRLINSIIATCPRHRRLHMQILTFFNAHNDIIEKLLELESNDLLYLRSLKLILSVYYQLYCGPFYIRNPNVVLSARDSTLLAQIQSKEARFNFLLRRYMYDIFLQSRSDELMTEDENVMYDESMYTQANGESKELLQRKILRLLLNIFRLKSIGSLMTNNCDMFLAAFNPNLLSVNIDQTQADNEKPPPLSLLCDCLIGVQMQSKQVARWLLDIDGRLLNISSLPVMQLQSIETSMPALAMDIRLYCFVIETLLILLYYHCECFLKRGKEFGIGSGYQFYQQFKEQIIARTVRGLQEWFESDECILNITYANINRIWPYAIDTGTSSTKILIHVLIRKFLNLERDCKQVLAIDQ